MEKTTLTNDYNSDLSIVLEGTPMNQSYKPEGYTSVAAYVMADGAQRVIDFLKATFDRDLMRKAD